MSDSIEKLVVIVDPNDIDRRDTVQHVASAGFRTSEYAAAEDLISDLQRLEQPSYFCAVLELDLPDTSGLILQRQLSASPHVANVVFYARNVHVRHVVRAMRQGAIAVVEKGEGVGGLLNFIEEALEKGRVRYLHAAACAETIEQLRDLSSGEQIVLRGIMAGKLNKEIAQELNLSIRTIEQRRREVFRKLQVQHPASLACKIMEVALAYETLPHLQREEATGWLTDHRIDGPSQFRSWRTRQAYWGGR